MNLQLKTLEFIEFFKPKSYGMGQYISVYAANKDNWSDKYASCTYEMYGESEYFDYERLTEDFINQICSHFECILEVREDGRKPYRIYAGSLNHCGILRINTFELEVFLEEK